MSDITQTVRVYFTSKDLYELAKAARELEKTATIGESTIIKIWDLGEGDELRVTLDVARSRKQGLMKG